MERLKYGKVEIERNLNRQSLKDTNLNLIY